MTEAGMSHVHGEEKKRNMSFRQRTAYVLKRARTCSESKGKTNKRPLLTGLYVARTTALVQGIRHLLTVRVPRV